MEPVPATSLNAVLAKFAKMEHALRDPLLAHFLARGNVLEVKSALMENASDNPLLADVLQSDVIEDKLAEMDNVLIILEFVGKTFVKKDTHAEKMTDAFFK
jgi:hypothetical protein